MHPAKQMRACETVIMRDLPTACRELSEWWRTGLLSDGVIRSAAKELKSGGFQDPIRIAERFAEQAAVRIVGKPTEERKGEG